MFAKNLYINKIYFIIQKIFITKHKKKINMKPFFAKRSH